MTDALAGRRVMVTGGGGFLGRARRRPAARPPAPATIFVAAQRRLRPARRATAIERALADGRPDVVIHLAAVVGGIGANRENPGRFFYENAIMGIQLMEQARLAGVDEVRHRSARSAPTRSSRRCRSARTTSGTATRRRRTRPTAWPRRCSSSRARPTAQQYGFNAIYLIPVNLYGPGDNFDPASSHVIPALIKKCVDAREAGADHIDVWGTGAASREFLYVDDAAEGIVLAAERYDGAEPVNLGVGREITIRDLVELIVALTGFAGEIRWDADEARRPAAPRARHQPGPRALRVRGRDRLRGRAAAARSSGTGAAVLSGGCMKVGVLAVLRSALGRHLPVQPDGPRTPWTSFAARSTRSSCTIGRRVKTSGLGSSSGWRDHGPRATNAAVGRPGKPSSSVRRVRRQFERQHWCDKRRGISAAEEPRPSSTAAGATQIRRRVGSMAAAERDRVDAISGTDAPIIRVRCPVRHGHPRPPAPDPSRVPGGVCKRRMGARESTCSRTACAAQRRSSSTRVWDARTSSSSTDT